jgi:hypothetical protein
MGRMKIEDLRIGLRVRHPQYAVGVVQAISAHTAEIRFPEGPRVVEPVAAELTAAEPQAALTGLTVPLAQLIQETVEATAALLGMESPDGVVEKLGLRWQGGRLVMHPTDPTLTTKEIPLEVFFHKIVMVRNQLRVLEQKINSHEKLSDAEKVEMQQYVTRCQGSLTTFNLLFKEKEDQF